MDADTTQDNFRWHKVSPARGEGMKGKEQGSLVADQAGFCSRSSNLRPKIEHSVKVGGQGRHSRLEGREERREGRRVKTHVARGTRRK